MKKNKPLTSPSKAPYKDRKKARNDLGIDDPLIEEEEKAADDEKLLAKALEEGLIKPEPIKLWEATDADAGRMNKEGRPVIFESAERLRKACTGYFELMHANPEYKSEFKEGAIRNLPCRPLFTLKGLGLYLGVGESYWRDKRAEMSKRKDTEAAEFSAVIQWVDDIVTENKYQGATHGFFKATIISQELGFSTNVNIEVNDKRKETQELFPTQLVSGLEGLV